MHHARVKAILKKARRLEFNSRQLVGTLFSGSSRSAFKGRGLEFDQVRQYVPGDPTHAIDWNVTARAGRPYVKSFVEERELTVTLMVDVSGSSVYGSVDESKRERMAEIAAVLAFSAQAENHRVSLVLFSDQVEHVVPPGKGRAHAFRLVLDLLTHEPRGRMTDLGAALKILEPKHHGRGMAVLISDLMVPDEAGSDLRVLKNRLAVAARECDLVAIEVTDPCDHELPNVGLLTMLDAETGAEVEVQTSSKAVREAWRREAARRRKAIHSVFHRAAVPILALSTSEEYLPRLAAFVGGPSRGGHKA